MMPDGSLANSSFAKFGGERKRKILSVLFAKGGSELEAYLTQLAHRKWESMTVEELYRDPSNSWP
jgi:hypothetical protein